MKKFFSLLVILLSSFALSLQAQNIVIYDAGQVVEVFDAAHVDSIVYVPAATAPSTGPKYYISKYKFTGQLSHEAFDSLVPEDFEDFTDRNGKEWDWPRNYMSKPIILTPTDINVTSISNTEFDAPSQLWTIESTLLWRNYSNITNGHPITIDGIDYNIWYRLSSVGDNIATPKVKFTINVE